MSRVLVAYATKYGSTEDVAHVIGSALGEAGHDVDLIPVRDVVSLDGYAAVVVGAALYAHKWHRDAARFVTRNRMALTRVPVAIFAVGPVNDTTEEFDAARAQLDRALARWDWLSPASSTVFGGRLDPTRLHVPGASRLLAKVPESDIVDPVRIREWAESLPRALAIG